MSTVQPILTDPDKLGLLLQCRQKMDELNTKQLHEYANFTLQLLSTHQLKCLIFVGLNSIKNDISYNQLFHMKTSINEIIETAKKLKNKSKPKTNLNTNNTQSTIPIVPKNASLTKIIPFDIISNNICHFLKMSSITKLAQCDRKLAIICHTPTSITNLMHRYDFYKYAQTDKDYMIDGHYTNIRDNISSNMHRFKNIETLSIDLEYVNSENRIKILNTFGRVKHLSFVDLISSDEYDFPPNQIQLMPHLETLSFINIAEISNLIYLLQQYKNNPKTNYYYNEIIYQIQHISFVDCQFSSLHDIGYEDEDEIFYEYKNVVNFILPSQPNNLKILKFENAWFEPTDHTECKAANNEFSNVNRIKHTLSNLTGFVYEEPTNGFGLHSILVGNILSNLIWFKYLISIHTHSATNVNLCISSYFNNNNKNALSKLTELCMSIKMNQKFILPMRSMSVITMFASNVEKLCLVIDIEDNDKDHTDNFAEMVQSILRFQIKLKLFQIVTIVEDIDDTNATFCSEKINIVSDFSKKLVDTFNSIRSYFIDTANQTLLFKFHVKTSHPKLQPECSLRGSKELEPFVYIIQNMIMNYLMTYPIGKIQFKYSWNGDNHFWMMRKIVDLMKGLDRLFRVSVKTAGCLSHLRDEDSVVCYSDMDFRQYAISVTQKNNPVEGIVYENKWKVDCRYCCNTPWV